MDISDCAIGTPLTPYPNQTSPITWTSQKTNWTSVGLLTACLNKQPTDHTDHEDLEVWVPVTSQWSEKASPMGYGPSAAWSVAGNSNKNFVWIKGIRPCNRPCQFWWNLKICRLQAYFLTKIPKHIMRKIAHCWSNFFDLYYCSSPYFPSLRSVNSQNEWQQHMH